MRDNYNMSIPRPNCSPGCNLEWGGGGERGREGGGRERGRKGGREGGREGEGMGERRKQAVIATLSLSPSLSPSFLPTCHYLQPVEVWHSSVLSEPVPA